jgi:hypothetical protein
MVERTSETQLLSELDAAHSAAIDAFSNKDIGRYRVCFTPGLKYTQAHGQTIGLDQLMSDVKAQFDRVHSLGTSYDRIAVNVHSKDRVTETLKQSAWVKIRVFVFFTKHWSLVRKGDYTWQRIGSQWKLDQVVVHSESVT